MDVRVKLDKADFYELRSLIADLALIELQAAKAGYEFKERAALALQAKDTKWAVLSKMLNLDQKMNYRLDDKDHTLVPVGNGDG